MAPLHNFTRTGGIMNREAMIDVVKKSMKYQDDGEIEKQLTLYAENCTFKMPVNDKPMQGLGELRKSVEKWPKSITEPEWFAIDGNRAVATWKWRAQGSPAATPTLRGVSIYVFNDAGLIQNYEDFFDPDWITRHAAKT